MNIPYLSFEQTNDEIREDMLQAYQSVFESRHYVLGPQLMEFEQAFADFCETGHCVGVGSGLDALRIALQVLGIGEGDEVILPSNTYIATLLAVSAVGAKPVLVEPRIQTYNLNPERIEAAISPRTKAILPVHLYGQSCEMQAISSIAEKHALNIVEDNAQSQGASYGGIPTGSWGALNATSFYPGKNLGALGEAGAITTHREDLAERCCQLRNYGSLKKYHHPIKGLNSRMDELQAAFLLVKLAHLRRWNAERQVIAAEYTRQLTGLEEIILPVLAPHCTSVFHIFPIRTHYRNELQAFLQQRGIQCLIHYPIPPHLQPAYQELGFQKGDFPIAEKIADTQLSLPIFPGLTSDQIAYICQQIHQFFH